MWAEETKIAYLSDRFTCLAINILFYNDIYSSTFRGYFIYLSECLCVV